VTLAANAVSFGPLYTAVPRSTLHDLNRRAVPVAEIAGADRPGADPAHRWIKL